MTRLETPGGVLVIDRGRRRRFDESSPRLDGEDLRAHVPGHRVLDGRRGDEFFPALEHTDGVIRLHRAVTFLDDDELAVEKAWSRVVETLRCQSCQENDVFGRRELLDDFGETALARAALGEDDRGEGVRELSQDRNEIEESLVGLFSDVAQSINVFCYLVEKGFLTQKQEGFLTLGIRDDERRLGIGGLVFGCFLSFDQKFQEVFLDRGFLNVKGFRDTTDKLGAASRGVEVEGIDVEPRATLELHRGTQSPHHHGIYPHAIDELVPAEDELSVLTRDVRGFFT